MSEQTEQVEQRNKRYNKYVNAVTPKSSIFKSLIKSFWVGGVTCLFAQGIFELYQWAFPSLDTTTISAYMLCTIIVLAVILTGAGVFDKLGRYAGAGAFLPITGFANAMASSAMEFKTEGLILGSQTKFFSVVGPVLVNGVVWSALAGLIHYVISLF
ncbi:MAG: SpoVA/SpoVAEb family sporulation membrane protein [Firmicutes bacterium]|nr:SpoVA/SpoVAEb family sporulation membrane protein [Bacillota bacterium]